MSGHCPRGISDCDCGAEYCERRKPGTIDGDATHDWFLPKMVGHQCCRRCGVVRRYDHKNSPCKGQARIGLRDEYTEGSTNA